MAIAVISGLLVGVFEDFVGFVRFFELRFGLGIVDVAVGVQFLGLLAIGLFYCIGIRALGDTQHIVIVAF